MKYDDEKKWSKEVHQGAAVTGSPLGCELLVRPVFSQNWVWVVVSDVVVRDEVVGLGSLKSLQANPLLQIVGKAGPDRLNLDLR